MTESGEEFERSRCACKSAAKDSDGVEIGCARWECFEKGLDYWTPDYWLGCLIFLAGGTFMCLFLLACTSDRTPDGIIKPAKGDFCCTILFFLVVLFLAAQVSGVIAVMYHLIIIVGLAVQTLRPQRGGRVHHDMPTAEAPLVGARVRIKGMPQGHLNGALGRAAWWDKAGAHKGRYAVVLDSDPTVAASTHHIYPRNLEAVGRQRDED